MEIRPIDYYRDPDYCNCGRNDPVAILEAQGVKVAICYECLDDLRNSIAKFDNTVFCHQCENFKMSSSGWQYGGRCHRRSSEASQIVERDVDCMNTCKYAIKSQSILRRY